MDQLPHFVTLAIEKGMLNAGQLVSCRELMAKSQSIGLDMTMEEMLVKQCILSAEAIEELKEFAELTEGGGTVFGPYRLKKLIGEGGMGKVYEGVHEFMGRAIAIKVLSPQIVNDRSPVTRFLQEIRALAKLSHPNIVTLYDAGRICGKFYYTMELFPGADLKSYVDSKIQLREKEAVAIIRAIAVALGYAHEKNIVHRDVKPENIMIDGQNVPKITDFGLVLHQDDDHKTLTREGHWVGTYQYTSPEQVEGRRDLDRRTDIYSLGATLYYAITGKTLYTGGTVTEILTQHLTGKYDSPRKYSPYTSTRTVKLLKKMLAVDREKRYQTMEEVVAAIDHSDFFQKNSATIIGFLSVLGLVALGMVVEHFFPVLRDFLP